MEASSLLLPRTTPPAKAFLAEDEGGGTLTLQGATLTGIKSILGPAALYSPYGFEEGGILFALFMIGATYSLFSWSALNLLEVWGSYRDLDYAGMMSIALGGGAIGAYIIDFVTIAQQCGICLTYFVFVSKNLQEIAMVLFGFRPMLSFLCALQLLWYWPLTTLSSIERFEQTSMIANVLVCFSLTVFVVFAASRIFAGVEIESAEGESYGRAPLAKHWLFNKTTFYLFVGTSFFMFEGAVANIITIQNAVRNDLKPQFPRLFVRIVGGYSLFIAVFGLTNWLAFGDHININLTVNLPLGFWKCLVQLAYSTAVALTFPLQLFPAIETLMRLVSTARIRGVLKEKCSRSDMLQRMVDATPDRTIGAAALCTVLCFIAIAAVDHLPGIVSLVGALFGIPYSFCFPSYIHLKLVPHSKAWVKNVNLFVIISGISLSCVCSALSIWSSLSGSSR